ncbi:glutamate-1-semialdehyde 2,1-aminomutase [Enterococcus casseliflavus]|uniref:glutamate-1-semialdehyde 2,1-aminomutase n=1 Tax=Enterococcus casseliflavus TaxID=37734 RepID=UPI0022E760E8|nr:glutamate-1-semialdehyde 2,1-aminomutase [Enterococcus casseliflavus]MEB6085999.1 glutamate-1-semialdehyde 2,1-aminomutase [Enterococcus casseliflavus]
MDRSKSQKNFTEAKEYFPGGVNSPVRAFGAVGGEPIFIEKAKGAYLYDVDGNKYIDYVLSWGPMILGHAEDAVVAAVTKAASNGTSFGAPTALETQLAKLIRGFLPSMEEMRMVNSGTEATMSAVRLARAVTKKEKIITFKGNYHGHSDSFLVNAGSGAATFEIKNSPGVPHVLTQLTLSAPFNDLEATKHLFSLHDDIAAVIVEPIAGNMGLVPGTQDFLEGIRNLTKEHGALLIFDEVMSGFRCGLHSAQGLYGIEPDLTTLGKVVGGGLPAAVYGGKRQYLSEIAPVGPVYQAGTLSGNPLAMAAGIAVLQQLEESKYQKMTDLTERLTAEMCRLASKQNLPLQTQAKGSMWGYFFNDQPVTDFARAKCSNLTLFASIHRKMISQGIYLAPSQFEAGFVSTQHTDKDIDQTLAAFERAFFEVKKEANRL